MTFDDISTGIQRAWDFVAPPTVRITAILGVTYFVNPHLLTRFLQFIGRSVDPALLSDAGVHATLEFYGLTKLIPLVSVVLLLALMNLVQKLVLSLGQILPPQVTTIQPTLFRCTANDDIVRKLWRHHRGAENLHELRLLLESRFNHLDQGDRRDTDYWSARNAKAFRAFSTLKFLALWDLLLLLVGRLTRESGGGEGIRAAVMLGIILIGSMYMVATFLYGSEQCEYAFINAVLGLPPSGETAGQTDEQIDDALANEHEWRWWNLRLSGSSEIIRWARKNLLRRLRAIRFQPPR